MSGLFFDIQATDLELIGAELGATEKQVRNALSAALRRTATTLKTLAARALKDELQLRTLNLLRKRLKSLKVRVTQGDGMQLWFGLNDIPTSWFKGTPKQTATGATFRGVNIDGAFVAKSKYKNRLTMFKRVGTARLHIEEQNMPVMDQAAVLIEDKIFTQTETIFWQHFRRDLSARVKYQLDEWKH